MRTLYHLWLSPFSRKVRVVLAEKNIDFQMNMEQVWERRREFLALNPSGEVPVLVEPDNTVLADSTAICEYLEEHTPDPNLNRSKSPNNNLPIVRTSDESHLLPNCTAACTFSCALLVGPLTIRKTLPHSK